MRTEIFKEIQKLKSEPDWLITELKNNLSFYNNEGFQEFKGYNGFYTIEYNHIAELLKTSEVFSKTSEIMQSAESLLFFIAENPWDERYLIELGKVLYEDNSDQAKVGKLLIDFFVKYNFVRIIPLLQDIAHGVNIQALKIKADWALEEFGVE
jgi:hypothetical protein